MTELSYLGVSVALGLVLFVLPWKGQPAWRWAQLYATRNRPIEIPDPVTVVNDRSGGGVRYQDGVAVTAIQLLGRPHRATTLIGSTITATENVIDLADLMTLTKQHLGLAFESVSVVSSGARRRSNGDYPRVYDTFIGTSPYAGHRETWLVLRLNMIDNAETLQWRISAGRAALAATQRLAAALSCRGIRARVGSATDIVDLDRTLAGDTLQALQPSNRRWHSLRGETGALTTYGCPITDLNLPWSLRADGIIQNLTLYPDATVTASVTVRTPQQPAVSPNTALQPLPGRQAQALGGHLCAPLRRVRGLPRLPLPASLKVPIGSSGVLLGKMAGGDRLVLPLDEPGAHSHVHIAACDAIAKRIVIRMAAAGGQIAVHSTDSERWSSIRMPNVVVTDQIRPPAGTTVSVVDGTVMPAPRPPTVVSVNTTDGVTDLMINQTGPTRIEVSSGGRVHDLDFELFRAENRYAPAELEPAA